MNAKRKDDKSPKPELFHVEQWGHGLFVSLTNARRSLNISASEYNSQFEIVPDEKPETPKGEN